MESFSKSKIMELPRHVVVGHGALEEIGRVCKELNLRAPGVIVADKTTKQIAGERVAEYMQEADIPCEFEIIEHASTDEVQRVNERIAKENQGFVMGVGGGRPIDVAKCAAYDSHIPHISVPTAASHDGIVSSRAAIWKDGRKISLKTKTPLAMVADTAIIARSPSRLLSAGCGDVIANVTAVLDWKLAYRLRNEQFSSYASHLARRTAELLMEDASLIKPNVEDSAWIVAKALVSSGVSMCIAGSSRPASGSEHKFSHALDATASKPGLHGEQCGLGTIMMMYLHGGEWEKIRDALKIIGAPVTARKIGLGNDEVLNALMEAHNIKPERYTILGDNGLTQDAAEHVAKITGVIS